MRILLLSLPLLFVTDVFAGPESIAAIQVESDKVADGVYMLRSRGGNIGVSAGADGIFLIDDQYAPLTPKILAALKELAGEDSKVRFVLNTHVHGDHTGGNENLGSAGAVIVAHENVRKRMTTGQFRQEFLQSGGNELAAALPVVTFRDGVTFHVNGRTLRIRHYPHAHTDGDSAVWFEEDNIVHMGDLYFEIGYPFIDLDRGGSVDGFIKAVEDVLKTVNDDTVIMPGHGKVSDKTGLTEYHAMLVDLRAQVRNLLKARKSAEEIAAMKLSEKYDARWNWQFIDGERFIATLIRDAQSR